MNPLHRKLLFGADLTANDEQKIEQLCALTREVEGRTDLIREGERPDDVHLVLDGVACRYKLLDGGQRQIVALMLPGDFCDLHVAMLGAMDHCISTITQCRIVEIPKNAINDIAENHPRILKGLWWATLVDEAVLREWLVSMGRRNASQQMAHFFCEMFTRCGLVGLADEHSFALPLTQQDLGDTLGLSTVHVNRTLQELRKNNFIEFASRRIILPNAERIFKFAGFSTNYLHLNRRGKASLL